MEKILVVCVGNICRSPMAKALLETRYPNKIIDSAGVAALVNHPADSIAVSIMAKHNIDISQHRAKQISLELTINADLILTMSSSETDWIHGRWSHCRGKTFRLGHWLNEDIADPYKLGVEAFETVYKHIEENLNLWQDKIS